MKSHQLHEILGTHFEVISKIKFLFQLKLTVQMQWPDADTKKNWVGWVEGSVLSLDDQFLNKDSNGYVFLSIVSNFIGYEHILLREKNPLISTVLLCFCLLLITFNNFQLNAWTHWQLKFDNWWKTILLKYLKSQ